jgi:hypothetical protein
MNNFEKAKGTGSTNSVPILKQNIYCITDKIIQRILKQTVSNSQCENIRKMIGDCLSDKINKLFTEETVECKITNKLIVPKNNFGLLCNEITQKYRMDIVPTKLVKTILQKEVEDFISSIKIDENILDNNDTDTEDEDAPDSDTEDDV